MKLLLALLLLVSPAFASQEQIHRWKSATVTATTDLFGDVEMTVTADDKGNLKTLVVKVKGKTIDVPAKWIATLPAVPIASLEIRTERGRGKEPWLYAFFRTGSEDVKGTIRLHVMFRGGKLEEALKQVTESATTSKSEFIKAP